MGNSGSHSQIAQPLPLDKDQKWAHSFPRTPSKRYQHKVLPDRDAPLRLRPTNNGEILHSGGTLSGRHHQNRLSFEEKSYINNGVYRSNSISSTRPNEHQQCERPRSPPTRNYVSHHKDLLRKSGQRYSNNDQRHGKGPYANRREQMKRFDSEPDLRDASSRTLDIHVQDRSKARKKYKAPPPPPMAEKSSDSWEADSEPARKARLFKTRAETKKKSSPVNNRRSLEENESKSYSRSKQLIGESIDREMHHNRLSLPEIKRTNSIPEFQAELKEATKRLRNTKILEEKEMTEKLKNEDESNAMKSKLKTLDHNITRKEILRNKLKEIEEKENKFNDVHEPSRISKDELHEKPIIKSKERDGPKTFYFGMEQNKTNSIPRAYSNNNLVDHFVSTLHNHTNIPLNSSGSDLSSELDLGESQVSTNGIALQLRPILPKKQFEIPRFSPATAWKLLSAVESNHAPSTAPSDDVPMFIEDRIEKLSRLPPPPTVDGPRSSHDKSGDSGISGDAGPAGFDEGEPVVTNQNLPINNFRSTGVSWTPQQDLGDDSSIEDNNQPANNQQPYNNNSTPRFSARPHVFSLSLPRDNHLSSYLGDKSGLQVYTGLQKLKRSVSGVLNNLSPVQTSRKEVFHSFTNQEQSDNWFLSKSAPNSLNNGFNSLELKPRKFDDDDLLPANPQNTGRVMYLPKLDENLRHQNIEYEQNEHKPQNRNRSRSAERSTIMPKMSLLSKSCENISGEIKSSSEPEDLQDPPKFDDKWKNKKPKRFTFQSTVRQIERKRLAEKLSREAEKKEKQRLRELEAMQKVEEEFQKKRAREKASIRQQLRLFSMDDTAWSSLPPNLNNMKDNNNIMSVRQEPDGAVSSSTPSPIFLKESNTKRKSLAEMQLHPRSSSSDTSEENKIKATSTKVLSEYRQPQREYKDFRGRYPSDFSEPKQTIHPEVTYHMPMAHAYQGSSSSNVGKSANYRKDFAHGKKNSKSGGSTYSEDSQTNANHTPMMYHSKRAPLTRF